MTVITAIRTAKLCQPPQPNSQIMKGPNPPPIPSKITIAFWENLDGFPHCGHL